MHQSLNSQINGAQVPHWGVRMKLLGFIYYNIFNFVMILIINLYIQIRIIIFIVHITMTREYKIIDCFIIALQYFHIILYVGNQPIRLYNKPLNGIFPCFPQNHIGYLSWLIIQWIPGASSDVGRLTNIFL